ncbi:enoyl-CoA hydratase/isomerase family protein [Seohaeicola saemankumensis]|uniref:Enoyl-CoA hydratase/isomerase family protein n=1 Tax=Seohaeicola saemankumensis TaxID=481181 RepID=A0ABW3TC71_9RHOB
MSGPDTGKVDVTLDSAIAVIRFSNPPEGFMDEGTEAGLTAALDQVDTDDAIRAVILTGAQEGVFIRHYDVRILEARSRKMAARGMVFTPDRPVPEPALHRAMRRIENSPKPYIAAINGTAMGGGFELALACDIRLAQAGDYPIGLPEVNLGILPGAGGTQRLPLLVGQARTLEYCLTGRTFTPEEAAKAGLVNACVADPVLDHALGMARRMAGNPPLALAHIKRLIRGATPDPERMALERTLFCDLMVQDEAIEIMARMNRNGSDIRNP